MSSLTESLLACTAKQFPQYTEDEILDAMRSATFEPDGKGGLVLNMRLMTAIERTTIEGTVSL